jgi:hypothetical protein
VIKSRIYPAGVEPNLKRGADSALTLGMPSWLLVIVLALALVLGDLLIMNVLVL